MKKKKRQLDARINKNNNNNDVKQCNITETDKAALLAAKMAQKRKNPFAKYDPNKFIYITNYLNHNFVDVQMMPRNQKLLIPTKNH